jgi:hypothetical protein
MITNIRAVLYGTLVGTIWMPAIECTKDVQVDLTRERERLTPTRGGSLRHMICSITNDGDFQSARLSDDSFIEVTCWRRKGNTTVKRSKQIPITAFHDIQDCVVQA